MAFAAIQDRYATFLFLIKWPPATILDGRTMSIIELVRDIWMSNACVKFEECSLNPSKVIALTHGRGDQEHSNVKTSGVRIVTLHHNVKSNLKT